MSEGVFDEARSVAVLVLGAGRGERLGQTLPKAFVPLAGKPLIERSIRAVVEAGVAGTIQPVLASGDFELFEALGLHEISGLARPVAGGAERQDSVRAGLRALSKEIRWVAVHDAARCLVAPADIRAVVRAAMEFGAAILAEPVRDTIKRVAGETIVETPPREACWAAQTPQVARVDWLAEAIEKAAASGRLATDDAQLLEWAGHSVRVVESRGANPKITRPEDLAAAEAIARAREGPEGRSR